MNDSSPFDPEVVKAFVIAAHGDLDRVQQMLAEEPGLLNVPHPWSETDWETPVAAAAHVGNRPIAEFLLEQGAPLEICTAAMLGRREEVSQMLATDPAQAQARGAHSIPLMSHVALGGDVAVAEMILAQGAQGTDVMDAALHMAVAAGQEEMVRWLLENNLADVNRRNSQGQTLLEIAEQQRRETMADLLRTYR